jgi:predicted PurR-regulated permease PerM
MIAIIFGGELFGIVGIIIAIPLAGIVPVIERIWLHGDTSHP